jgi:Mn2+/Fe2+ NRAMP family transporter
MIIELLIFSQILLLFIQTFFMIFFIYLYFNEKNQRERLYKELSLFLYDKITYYIDNNMKEFKILSEILFKHKKL